MKRWFIDIIFISIVVLLSILIVYKHLTIRVKTIGRDYRFEQEWLVSAISVACKQGFTTPVAPYPENMRLFLEQKTDLMKPSDLPKDWQRWDNSPFVKTHRYLIMSIGYLWRWFGIRWGVLKLFAGIIFVITVLSTYITIYMLAGRLSAIITACLVMNAPSLLFLLPSIRDYSKATFFMLFLAVVATLLCSMNRETRRIIFLSLLLGLVIGLGLGFRQDVLILFLPGVLFVGIVCVYMFRKKKIWTGILSMLAYLFAFFSIGSPILSAVAQDNGAVSSHSLVQGLATTVEQKSLGGTASYRLVYEPDDMLVHSTIASYARRIGFQKPFDNYLSPAYGEAGRSYFKSVIRHFPADLWGRTLSACSNCFTMPYHFFREQKQNCPEFSRPSWIFFPTDHFKYWDIPLAYIGPWICLGILFLMGMKSIGKGILLAVVLGYLLGYPSILFEYRHIVHLTPILYGITVIFFVKFISSLITLASKAYKKELERKTVVLELQKGVFVLLFVVISCTLLYGTLLLWQKRQVSNLASSYSQFDWEKVETTKVEKGNDTLFQPSQTLSASEQTRDLPPMETPFEFLRADFELTEPISIYSRYEDTYKSVDFSEPLSPLLCFYEMRTTRPLQVSVYFLVYYASTIKPRNETIFLNQEPIIWVRGNWKGIELPGKFESSFQGLYRAKNTSAEPFLMTVAVPHDAPLKGDYKHWRFSWEFKNVQENIKIANQYVLPK